LQSTSQIGCTPRGIIDGKAAGARVGGFRSTSEFGKFGAGGVPGNDGAGGIPGVGRGGSCALAPRVKKGLHNAIIRDSETRIAVQTDRYCLSGKSRVPFFIM